MSGLKEYTLSFPEIDCTKGLDSQFNFPSNQLQHAPPAATVPSLPPAWPCGRP